MNQKKKIVITTLLSVTIAMNSTNTIFAQGLEMNRHVQITTIIMTRRVEIIKNALPRLFIIFPTYSSSLYSSTKVNW